jgi:reactive intermediate/imine deaminase
MTHNSALKLFYSALFFSFAGSAAMLSAPEEARGPASGPQYFAPPSNGASLPLSEAVRVNEMLYLTGQIGTIPGTANLVEGGVSGETRRVLENMKAILERHGSSLEHVVKCTIFLVDMKDRAAFNEVYREFFKTNLPARSTVAVSGLALGAKIEIECIAFIPTKK